MNAEDPCRGIAGRVMAVLAAVILVTWALPILASVAALDPTSPVMPMPGRGL